MFTLVENAPEFLLVSKHAGVDFHKGRTNISLVETIRMELNISELYPLHRLDTMTSGLLLFAKSRPVAAELAAQFRTHSIEKFYIALAGTHPKKKQGLVCGDMVRSRNGTWALTRTMKTPAVTQFYSAGMGNGLRLYLLKPFTGKTHQIRVAMKSLGVPILGDPLYNKKQNDLFTSDRGYLHAYALKFTVNNKTYRFTDMPTEGTYFTDKAFRDCIRKFSDPWSLAWRNVPSTSR